MELPQTHLLIRHLNSRNLNVHYIGNFSWTCIPEECSEIMSNANCSCLSNFTNITKYFCPHKHEMSDPDIPVVLWSLSSVILAILVFELLAIRFNFSYLKSFFGKLVFLMGIVCSLVTQLCTVPYLKDNSSNLTVYYNMSLGIITILFTIFGFSFLFQKCPDGNIGSHDKGMGLVLAIITVPLVVLEAVLIVEIFRTRHLSNALGWFLLVWIFEKVIQLTFYVLVRKCKALPEYNDGVIFYFSFLSFLNFTMWLNSIPFTEIKLYDEVSNKSALWLVDRTFKALVIDYRLLSTLLFLEHAVALSETNVNEQHVYVQEDNEFVPPKDRWWYTIGGISIGFLCLLMEIANGVQFWIKDVPNVVNLGPVMSDVILVFFGSLLLYSASVKISHNKKVALVTLMVTSIGAVSVVYLLIFGLLCLIVISNNSETEYKDHHDYVIWSTVVFFVRALSLVVLLIVYSGVPFSVMASASKQNNKNYFVTWALFVGLLARFVGSVLEEFHGTMHEIAHHYVEPKHLRSLKDLFNIGPLFQLATCLHLALHFLLMILRLHKPPRNVLSSPLDATSDEHGPPSGFVGDGEHVVSDDTDPSVVL